MTLTLVDVVDTVRKDSGAKSVHLDLAPGADLEEVQRDLLRVNALSREYDAYPEVARVKAQNVRLRELLRQAARLAQGSFTEEEEVLRRKLQGVFRLADLVPDVDLDKDLAWMKANGYAPVA